MTWGFSCAHLSGFFGCLAKELKVPVEGLGLNLVVP